MATISRFSAVALVGNIRVTGFIAWLMWLVVHLVYMTGYKNRITALGHWAISFLGSGRSERATTEQQIFGRRAIAKLEGGTAAIASSPDEWNKVREQLEAQAAEESRLSDEHLRGVHAS